RHTRFSRDWSSDVCSSDLENSGGNASCKRGICNVGNDSREIIRRQVRLGRKVRPWCVFLNTYPPNTNRHGNSRVTERQFRAAMRSEERRVGKEGKAMTIHN